MKKLGPNETLVSDCKMVGSILAHADYKYLYGTNKDIEHLVAQGVAKYTIDLVEGNRMLNLIDQYIQSSDEVDTVVDRITWVTKEGKLINAGNIELFHAKNIHNIVTQREQKLLQVYSQNRYIDIHKLMYYGYWITMCEEILPKKFKKEEANNIMTELFSEDESNEKFEAFKNLLNNDNQQNN